MEEIYLHQLMLSHRLIALNIVLLWILKKTLWW